MASPPPVVGYAVFFALAAVLIFLVGEYLAWVYRDQANRTAARVKNTAYSTTGGGPAIVRTSLDTP